MKDFKSGAQRPLESGGLAHVDPLKQRQQWMQGQRGSELLLQDHWIVREGGQTTTVPDCQVEQEDDDAEMKLPMQVRIAVIAGTTLMLWGGFIAGLRALIPHIVT
jgi:hypothetical protein